MKDAIKQANREASKNRLMKNETVVRLKEVLRTVKMVDQLQVEELGVNATQYTTRCIDALTTAIDCAQMAVHDEHRRRVERWLADNEQLIDDAADKCFQEAKKHLTFKPFKEAVIQHAIKLTSGADATLPQGSHKAVMLRVNDRINEAWETINDERQEGSRHQVLNRVQLADIKRHSVPVRPEVDDQQWKRQAVRFVPAPYASKFLSDEARATLGDAWTLSLSGVIYDGTTQLASIWHDSSSNSFQAFNEAGALLAERVSFQLCFDYVYGV